MTPDEVTRRIGLLHAEETPAVESFFAAADGRGALVVLPSAFNPPTDAHFALLRLAAERAAATPGALLTTRNVAKGLEGAPLPDRVGMLLAARDVEPRLAVLVANVARFVDQARALRRHLPGREVSFVAGYDTLVRIFDSRYYDDMAADLQELFDHHRVYAANRAAAGTDDVREFIRGEAGAHAGAIEVIELPEREAGLSSTRARETAHAEVAGVPEAVRDYIRRQGLYRA